MLWACANPDRNFAPPAATEPKPELTAPAEIAAALAKGGYLLYARHGETNRDEAELEGKNRETGRFSIEDCATQRNLSAQGREEARRAGTAYRRAGIPVARHLSSRYCRALQTAKLYADNVELSEALTSEGAITKSPERIAAVRALLSTRPPPGQNLMLFAHQGIFYAATNLTVQEGWTVVLEPGNFNRIVARIAPGGWDAIARAR
jgi:phosphohistidine phosphatase SixA